MTKTTAYKDSPIGKIPSDWEVKKLGEVAEIKTGDKDTQNKIDNGLYPFFVRSDNVERINSYSYDGEAILTSGDGVGVGKNFHYINGKFDFHQRVYSIRKFEMINGLFTYYYFSNCFYHRVKRLSAKNSVDSVRMEMISDMLCPLPPLPEQEKIAEILSTWDKAIQETDAIIKKLEARNKALAFSLLRGKKRVKGFKGKWRNTNFGEITEKISRRNKDLINAEVYSVTNTKGFVLQSDHFEGKVAGEDLSNYKVIKKNEFAYNPARINVGSLAYFEDEIGVISSLYVCFKTTEDILDYYLLQYLQTDYVNSRINALGEGGVRIYLWYELFSKIKISLPSLEEQNAIAEILNTANQEVKQYQKKLTQLKEQKKGLMQQLLTGKVRTIKM